MSRTDPSPNAPGLPGFLDDPAAEATAMTTDDVATDADALAELAAEVDAPGDAWAQPAEPHAYGTRAPYVRRRPERPAPAGGGLATALGMLCWLGTGGLVAAGNALPPVLAEGLLVPGLLFVVGAVAFAAAAVQRALRRGAADLRSPGAGGADAGIREQLEALLARSDETDGTLLEDSQQLRLVLQRLDDKINNLTRAIKMYGKPLLDIANHTAEVDANLAQVRGTVEAGNDSLRNGHRDLERLLAEQRDAMPALDPLQQQLEKVGVAVAAMTQRLEDSEARKALLRLEEASRQTQERLGELLRGESIDAAAKGLQEQIESSTARLHQGLGQLRDGNLGDLESTVRDIQREMAAVATGVSQIQAAVKNLARPAPAAPARPAAPAAPPPTPAAAAPAAPSPAPAAPAADEDAGGYQTGARKTGGKNVLGAIAKLRQMKG